MKTQELSNEEMKEINGGFSPLAPTPDHNHTYAPAPMESVQEMYQQNGQHNAPANDMATDRPVM